MKKFTKIFAIALVCILSVVTLAACDVPNTNIDKAAANLQEKGYKVVVAKKDDEDSSKELAEMASMVYCVVDDLQATLQAKENDDNSYALVMIWFVNEELANSILELYKIMLEYSRKELQLEIRHAQSLMEKASEDKRDYWQESIDALKEMLDELDAYVCGVFGNLFYYGKKDAVDATK